MRGQWAKAKDACQAWILVILTGATVAFIAWFIDVVQEWMSDLKQGYCTTQWRYNRQFCCWDKAGKQDVIILSNNVVYSKYSERTSCACRI